MDKRAAAFHLSELTPESQWYCSRKVILKFQDTPETDEPSAETRKKWDAGRRFEELASAWARIRHRLSDQTHGWPEAQYRIMDPKDHVRGSPDLWDPKTRMLIEIKWTAGEKAFQPADQYLTQIRNYGIYLKPVRMIVIISTSEGVIECPVADAAGHEDRLRQEIERLWRFVDEDVLPDRLESGPAAPPCSNCGYRTFCWNGKGPTAERPMMEISTDLARAISDAELVWQSASMSADEAKQRLDQLRSQVPAPFGKSDRVVAGGFEWHRTAVEPSERVNAKGLVKAMALTPEQVEPYTTISGGYIRWTRRK